MTKQYGNSDRGPTELDDAERNRAFGGDSDIDFDISDRREGNTRLADSDDDALVVDVDDEDTDRYTAQTAYGEPPLDEGEKIGPWDEQQLAHGSDEDGSYGDRDAQVPYSAVAETEDEENGSNIGYNADDAAAGGLRADYRTTPDNPEERWDEKADDDPEMRWGSNRPR